MKCLHPVQAFGFEVSEIPLETFFRAVNGFGSPDGKAADLKDFTELLKAQRIVDMKIEPTGQPERVIVKQLILEDGTRLHFGSSSKGACCYYIEKKGPSCLEVVDNEIHAERNPAGTIEDREEGGRVTEGVGQPVDDEARAASDSAAAVEQSDSASLPSVSATNDVPAGGVASSDERNDNDQTMRV
jgi:hypothetical protein